MQMLVLSAINYTFLLCKYVSVNVFTKMFALLSCGSKFSQQRQYVSKILACVLIIIHHWKVFSIFPSCNVHAAVT